MTHKTFRTSLSSTLVFAAVMAARLAPARADQPKTQETAKPGAEFGYFVGTWRCQEKWSKSAFSPAYESTSTLEAADRTDGMWVAWSYVQDASAKNPHPPKGNDLWGYDPAQQLFVREKADNYAPGITHLTSKGFVGDTITWEGPAMTPKGPLPFKHTFKKLDDHTIEGRLYMGGQQFYQGKCARVADSAQLVRDFVDTVKNQRKLDRLGDYFRADYVEHNTTVAGFGKGVAGYQAFLKHLFSAFPDDALHIDEIVSNGELVAYRATESGTHKGTFLGIPATQKKATWTELQFFRIKDGKIVEHWVDVDLFAWFTQLGIIPPMKK